MAIAAPFYAPTCLDISIFVIKQIFSLSIPSSSFFLCKQKINSHKYIDIVFAISFISFIHAKYGPDERTKELLLLSSIAYVYRFHEKKKNNNVYVVRMVRRGREEKKEENQTVLHDVTERKNETVEKTNVYSFCKSEQYKL